MSSAVNTKTVIICDAFAAWINRKNVECNNKRRSKNFNRQRAHNGCPVFVQWVWVDIVSFLSHVQQVKEMKQNNHTLKIINSFRAKEARDDGPHESTISLNLVWQECQTSTYMKYIVRSSQNIHIFTNKNRNKNILIINWRRCAKRLQWIRCDCVVFGQFAFASHWIHWMVYCFVRCSIYLNWYNFAVRSHVIL